MVARMQNPKTDPQLKQLFAFLEEQGYDHVDFDLFYLKDWHQTNYENCIQCGLCKFGYYIQYLMNEATIESEILELATFDEFQIAFKSIADIDRLLFQKHQEALSVVKYRSLDYFSETPLKSVEADIGCQPCQKY